MSQVIRAIVADDEPTARDALCAALERAPDFEVVAECGTGEAAVARIRELTPDVVFLGAQLPEMSGFEVLARLGAESMPHIVFVAELDNFARQAFEVNALDYVLKPVDAGRFEEVLRHVRRQVRLNGAGHYADRLRALLEGLAETVRPQSSARAAYLARFVVKQRERIVFVPVNSVEWLEGARNYVRLHTENGAHLVRGPLTAIQEQLDPDQFARIHRSIIVNLDRVAEIQPWAGGDYIAVLKSGARLRVSRNFRDALLRPAAP